MKRLVFSIGLLAGWALKGLIEPESTEQKPGIEAQLAKYKAELQLKESELKRCHERIETLEAQLDAATSAAFSTRSSVAVDASSEVGDDEAEAPVEAPAKPDDLKQIEGIGPKIASMLQQHGITTFAQLAATDASRLQQILDEAGSRYSLADPETWPEQARLAAAGDQEGLKKLTDELKGGKRQ